MYKRILIALDGSKQAESVLGRAAALAASQQANIELLMVLPVPTMVIENGKVIATIDQEMERAQSLVHPYLETWRSRLERSGITASSSVWFGDPAEQIARFAREYRIDLIVMAKRARKGLDRLLKRSVTEKVMRTVTTPVLVVKAA